MKRKLSLLFVSSALVLSGCGSVSGPKGKISKALNKVDKALVVQDAPKQLIKRAYLDSDYEEVTSDANAFLTSYRAFNLFIRNLCTTSSYQLLNGYESCKMSFANENFDVRMKVEDKTKLNQTYYEIIAKTNSEVNFLSFDISYDFTTNELISFTTDNLLISQNNQTCYRYEYRNNKLYDLKEGTGSFEQFKLDVSDRYANSMNYGEVVKTGADYTKQFTNAMKEAYGIKDVPGGGKETLVDLTDAKKYTKLAISEIPTYSPSQGAEDLLNDIYLSSFDKNNVDQNKEYNYMLKSLNFIDIVLSHPKFQIPTSRNGAVIKPVYKGVKFSVTIVIGVVNEGNEKSLRFSFGFMENIGETHTVFKGKINFLNDQLSSFMYIAERLDKNLEIGSRDTLLILGKNGFMKKSRCFRQEQNEYIYGLETENMGNAVYLFGNCIDDFSLGINNDGYRNIDYNYNSELVTLFPDSLWL